jgi:hypothetical protein
MNKSIRGALLIFLGMAFGCAAAATIPISPAASIAGKWRCYDGVVMQTAEDYGEKKARYHTWWMNQIAPETAAGTVVPMPTRGEVVCVKH